jgi:hypothetical protein
MLSLYTIPALLLLAGTSLAAPPILDRRRRRVARVVLTGTIVVGIGISLDSSELVGTKGSIVWTVDIARLYRETSIGMLIDCSSANCSLLEANSTSSRLSLVIGAVAITVVE